MTKQLLWEQYKEEEGDNAYSNAQFGHYLHVEKFCTFVFTLFVLLSIRTACGSPTKKVYLTKDNTPSRLCPMNKRVFVCGIQMCIARIPSP